ncbi:MAG: hypothetical protein ACP5R1_02035, partial [Athalassotoga sp.]
MSVVVIALVLSSCFLPAPKTPPTFSVAPTTINAYSGQPFNLSVTGQGGNGISQIVATFQGSTVIKTSNPATFTFVAPNVIAQTYYNLGVTVYGKNGLSSSATEIVNVTPYTSVGSITYAVRLNNPYPHVYTYPAANNNQSVIFTVNVGNGAGMVGGVSVYVDGSAIPASPTTLSSVLKTTVAGTSFIVQKSFVALYSISLNHVGPHTYWVNFYGTNGSLLGSSVPGYFYISYPGTQKVTLSAATPLYNTNYINGVSGSVSFTAKATDYTSQYEGFLINGTPFATYLNIATAVSVLGKSYQISVPVSALTSAGSTTFAFKDASIDGNVVAAKQTYVVVKATPVLRASYKGVAPVNNVLYVGLTPSYFKVYSYDPYWLSSAATLSSLQYGNTPYTLTNGSTTTVDVSPLSNGATAAFTARVSNKANLSSTLALTVYRISVGPNVKWADVYGLTTVNGHPYSTSGTITVAASVIMTLPNLGNVNLVLSLPNNGTPSMFPLTRSSTGLWTGKINTANLLPGTYKSWISATDIAQNVATALTSPATVNVYRQSQGVFQQWLRTNPAASVNGYYKSATMGATINSQWIYAIKEVFLCNNGTISASTTGVGTSVYSFPITASGKYRIITCDNAGQRATGTYVQVNIDSSTPTLKVVPVCQVATKTSITITGVATELNSGISKLTLMYQTLGATGADNGNWVTIGSTSTNNATTVVYNFTWNNLQALPNGLYGLQLVGVSGVGNPATLTGSFSPRATPYVINDNSKLNVTFTPNATLVFTNKATYAASFTVNNESDIFGWMQYTKHNGSATSSSFGPYLSYTIYPLTEATTLKFGTPNASYTYKAIVVNYAGYFGQYCPYLSYEAPGTHQPTALAKNSLGVKSLGGNVSALQVSPNPDIATSTTIFVYDTMKSSVVSFEPTNGAIFSYGNWVAAAGTP